MGALHFSSFHALVTLPTIFNSGVSAILVLDSPSVRHTLLP